MLSFQLFFEKCTPPVEVLSKYHEDPDTYISFTNSITPSTERRLPRDVEKAPNKKTNRLGLNPRTGYDTPAGIYSYPLKDYWDNIKEYNIPFVKEMPYVWVFKPKNPDKVAKTSTYSESDLERDLRELSEMFPKYHIEDLLNVSAPKVREAYPDYYNDDDFNHNSLHIADHYRSNPLQTFWSVTRAVARLILRDIKLSGSTKTKHITVWTHILRQFYDGIVDDTGSGTIHPNEPTQAVFWTASHITPLELIDRTCSVNKGRSLGDSEWTGSDDKSVLERILHNPKAYTILDRIFSSKMPYEKTKIGEQIIKNGGEDLLKLLKDSRDGDLEALESLNRHEFKNSAVTQLGFKLYLENKKGEEPFITKDMISNVSGSYLSNNVIKLLKYVKEPDAARRLLHYYRYYGEGADKTDLLHALRLMAEGDWYEDYIPTMIENELSGEFSKNPKLMKFILDYADGSIEKSRSIFPDLISSILPDYRQYYRKTGDSDMLMPILKKALTSSYLNFYSKMSILHKLDDYGGSIMPNMDELLEHIQDNPRDFVGGGHQGEANDIWFKFTGRDLFPKDDSQIETIRKSRIHKPTTSDYNEGDEIHYYKRNNNGYTRTLKAVIMKVLPPRKGMFEYSILDENGDESIITKDSIKSKLETDYDKNIQYGYTYEDQDGTAWRVITSPVNGRVGVRGRGGIEETKNTKDLMPFNYDNIENTLHYKAYNPPTPGNMYIYKNAKSSRDGTIVGIKSIDPINREVEMILPNSSYEHNTTYDSLVPFNEDDYEAEALSYEDVSTLTRNDILRSIDDKVLNYDSEEVSTFPKGTIFGLRSNPDDLSGEYVSDDGTPVKLLVKEMESLNSGGGSYTSFEILRSKYNTESDENDEGEKLKEGDVLGLLMSNGLVHKYIVRDVNHKMKRYELDMYTRKPNETHWKSLGDSYIGFNSLNEMLKNSKSVSALSINGELKKGDTLPNLDDVPLPKYSPGDVLTVSISNDEWFSYTIVDSEVKNNTNTYTILLTTQEGKESKTFEKTEEWVDLIVNSPGFKKSTDWEYLKV